MISGVFFSLVGERYRVEKRVGDGPRCRERPNGEKGGK